MTIEQFIQNVTEMWKAVEGKTDDDALIVLCHDGAGEGFTVATGTPVALRAILSSSIDHRHGENAEKMYGIVRDCFGAELMARVKAGVATGVKTIASRNIKDGKYIVKPPKEKS